MLIGLGIESLKMKWVLYITAAIIITVLMLRIWRYWDDRTLASTWRSLVATTTENPALFDSKQLEGLPGAARRFFETSIHNGTPLHTVVEITMHGEFSLGDKSAPNYLPMKACQILAPPFGFIWHVKAGKGMMQFSGSDAAYPGGSWTRFWLFGILPVARAGGTNDHALSSFGRFMGEAVFWSPASLLPSEKVIWKEIDDNTVRVSVSHDQFEQAFDITVDADGQLEKIQFERWSNANNEKLYQYQSFGGYLSDFQEFDGFLLPTTVVAGNHFGTDEYFPFFKVSVDSANFVTDSMSERLCKIDD